MAKTNKNASKKARKTKKVETPITIANYQKLAMRTCLPACKCWEYAYPQLKSEVCEMFAKHYGIYAKLIRGDFGVKARAKDVNRFDIQIRTISAIEDLKKELGDIAWSLALICEIGNLNFKEELTSAQKAQKRAHKDNEYNFKVLLTFPQSIREKLEALEGLGDAKFILSDFLEIYFDIFVAYCYYYQFKVSDVLRDNIRKLASRQKRGVIMGNGDNR